MFDLNCDLGEGVGNDIKIMPWITSCNVACGGHFGDRNTISETISLAKKHNVRVGAHPSYYDHQNFGRISAYTNKKEFQNSIRNQLDLFQEVLDNLNVRWNHIKAHGALYNEMAKDLNLAMEYLEVIKEYQNVSIIYLPSGFTKIIDLFKSNNYKVWKEGFADRRYEKDYSLLDRSLKGSVFSNISEIRNQILEFSKGEVTTINGDKISLEIDTVCLHSDTSNASLYVKELHAMIIKKTTNGK